ncbi:hypothetical protein HL667_00110 [Bradyrhizobium sp. 83012]|uniref:Uncharacterized protein n=1 Tax=Bradyrhizobium aeschynomenes TaxID=2734909 RepID=A0ABX2C601_9BRAD|nr:hypothetical protein [Bradyrhizobium aeschynomenes]NPU63398.1 hypothetical protein [Bradyrhizobium aeschynomenes]
MFTGVAGAAWLTVLTPILKALFQAGFSSLGTWLDKQRAEQTSRELGAARTTATINRESADAERRADQLAVDRPDIGSVVAGLERGDAF